LNGLNGLGDVDRHRNFDKYRRRRRRSDRRPWLELREEDGFDAGSGVRGDRGFRQDLRLRRRLKDRQWGEDPIKRAGVSGGIQLALGVLSERRQFWRDDVRDLVSSPDVACAVIAIEVNAVEPRVPGSAIDISADDGAVSKPVAVLEKWGHQA